MNGPAPATVIGPDTGPDTGAAPGWALGPVFLGATVWTVNGVNVFSANLARGLQALGADARVLLTEENCDRVQYKDRPLPRAADLHFDTLGLARSASWGAHWGALLRRLTEAGPCVYFPGADWRHSSICPLLPDEVLVVGVVHSDDPLHYDHVQRLGRSWNLVVAVSDAVARRTLQLCPELAGRLLTIPIGVRVPPGPPPLRPADGVLRVIYHGILKQHQKRVLDLPRIVAAARALGVPVQLTIVGAGPDEAALRQAAAPLVAEGAVRFHGLVAPDEIPALLLQHEVYLLASEFEGLPNALLEAMGHGCVPVVSAMDSGIPQVLVPGHNGLQAPVGDVAAFAQALQRLWQQPALRQAMAQAAWRSVCDGGFRVQDMVAAYHAALLRAADDVRSGRWRRPRGPLAHAPAQVAGVGLFPVALDCEQPGVGSFPSPADAEDFAQQRSGPPPDARQTRADAARAWACARTMGEQALQGLPVFISAPLLLDHGVTHWSIAQVRSLRAQGLEACLLVTEEDTALVQVAAPRLAVPPDVPVRRLALRGPDSWGARWGALLRLLEEAAPCVYIPNHDWRHASVVPALSRRVKVLTLLHDRGPLYHEQALRLADASAALVVRDAAVAACLRQAAPALAGRIHRVAELPGPGDAAPADAPRPAPRLLWVASGVETPAQQAALLDLARAVAADAQVPWRSHVVGAAPGLARALADVLGGSPDGLLHAVPGREPAAVAPGQRVQVLAHCDGAEFAALSAHAGWVLGCGPGSPAWPTLLDAMACGAVPLLPGEALWAEGGGPVLNAAAQVAALRAQWADAARWRQASAAARELARLAAPRADPAPQPLATLIRRVMAEADLTDDAPADQTRPLWRPGRLRPPPAEVAGQALFTLPLPHDADPAGPFVSEAEAQDFHREAATVARLRTR